MLKKLFKKEPEVITVAVTDPPANAYSQFYPYQESPSMPYYRQDNPPETARATTEEEIEDGWMYTRLTTDRAFDALNYPLVPKVETVKKETSMLDGVEFKLSPQFTTTKDDHRITSIIRDLSREINLEYYNYSFNLEHEVLENNT